MVNNLINIQITPTCSPYIWDSLAACLIGLQETDEFSTHFITGTMQLVLVTKPRSALHEQKKYD